MPHPVRFPWFLQWFADRIGATLRASTSSIAKQGAPRLAHHNNTMHAFKTAANMPFARR
jgi:hypothetical protein